MSQYYLQHRTTGLKVKNAHNLYLETLADLGPVGLLLLVAGLAAPLVAGMRAREEALVPVAFGGFAAYLLHAGADWDWQMTAVTLTALTCAVGMLSSAPPPRRSVLSSRGRGVRAGILAAIALVAVLRARRAARQRGRGGQPARRLGRTTGSRPRATPARRSTWEPWSADARIAARRSPCSARAATPTPARRSGPPSRATRATGRRGSTWPAPAPAGPAAALAHAKQLDPREPQVLALH